VTEGHSTIQYDVGEAHYLGKRKAFVVNYKIYCLKSWPAYSPYSKKKGENVCLHSVGVVKRKKTFYYMLIPKRSLPILSDGEAIMMLTDDEVYK